MGRFNGGKAYHGSRDVQEGRLRGSTGHTDYFHFVCPNCPDNHVMRLLDFEERILGPASEVDYGFKPAPARSFVLAIKMHCQQCGLTDFVKVGNTTWPAGTLQAILGRADLKLPPVETEPGSS